MAGVALSDDVFPVNEHERAFWEGNRWHYRSLTEQIYLELMAGVEKGLDYDEFLAKYSGSKGPLHNAFSRALPQLKAKCQNLFTETRQREERRQEANKQIAQGQERQRELSRAVRDADTRLKTDLD